MFDAYIPQNSQPRTLFPGGYKRPEIKIPNIVLQLSAAQILSDTSFVLDFVDSAVAKRVGVVVVNGGEGSSSNSGGGQLYEAACLLKSVIRDRAYLLVAERVDIAAAVNASGVLLSDQGYYICLPSSIIQMHFFDFTYCAYLILLKLIPTWNLLKLIGTHIDFFYFVLCC